MASDASSSAGEYVVVARRYRPQNFEELVGQQQVVQALQNAIRKNRVGHAYLFTGARGVGKTSAARIFAKALNCKQGASPTPCNTCDICEGIVAGNDVDVLEIDGASNRGIDEIRQLRANVSVRPSRARLKIYIIDEVHMLTTPAFNALLKTLEEPPEHVKFVFCTTDPEKIPITVQSRCQRFDFASVETAAIVGRLQEIVDAEKVTAEPAALELLARTAAGSMRDSQSLLEQLLSFSGEMISEADVEAMLGAASSSGIDGLVDSLRGRDTAAAFSALDAAMAEGADAGQIAEQLLGRFRDLMTAAVGAPSELLQSTPSSHHAELSDYAREIGLETILAALQILDQTVTRMRQSPHARLLLEMALARICNLDSLSDLPSLIAELRSGSAPAVPSAAAPAAKPPRRPAVKSDSAAGAEASEPSSVQKKKVEDDSAVKTPSSVEATSLETTSLETLSADRLSSETASSPTRLTAETAPDLWRQVVELLEDTTAEFARQQKSVAISGPNRLVVTFPATYTFHKSQCDRPERRRKIEEALHTVVGQGVQVEFHLEEGGPEPQSAAKPALTSQQRLQQLRKNEMVSEAIKLFDGEVTRWD